jgi:gamma-glutamyl hercynylcysteine S-oxide synthase
MKGASPATARELLRPSFRNWFRPHYPYVYSTFRLVQDVHS